MGGLVIDQVGGAVKALLERDATLAELVLSRERCVNDYERALDRDSLTFIALQQPVANDLRLARAIARVGLELERVGDEAKKIARFALQLGEAADARPGGRRGALPAAHGRRCRRRCCAAPCGALDEVDRDAGAARCWRATRNSTPSSPRRCAS